ncbi:MAG: polysialyltransferase family glycosyltransferase [Ruminococcus sp.]
MSDGQVLIIVNSIYQLFSAVHMKRSVLKEKNADLLLTDLVPEAKNYISRIEPTGLFQRVIFGRTAGLGRQYITESEQEIREGYAKADSIFRWILSDELGRYDEVYFANFDTFARMLAAKLYEEHSAFVCYEDGFSTYVIDYLREDRAPVNRTEEGTKIRKMVTKVMLYEPRLAMRGDHIPNCRLPRVSVYDSSLKELLNYIFAYRKADMWENFIFLEQSFRAEGIKSNDTSLMEECQNVVRPEHFIVKPHPRNPVNLPFELGLSRRYDSKVPWELFLMNEDGDRWNLLTVCSNAALTGRIVFGLDLNTVMLYRLFQGKVLWKEDAVLMRYLQKFYRQFSGKNYYVPGTVYELRNILQYLGGSNGR